MPFHNNVYYPYQSDPPGGQSSAGIPSLLNSPQSQRSSSGSGPSGPSAMSGAAPALTVFKFRPRRESVDWRRISAVDVDRVASELDFQTLQEHVMGVTFCSVEHERCPYCQNPVDPVLLKLFRLAQLTIEYLLHSQDFLTQSLQAAEEKLQAAALEKEQLHRQLQKQAEDTKTLKEELKQRKKIIVSQQSMINAGMGGYHKCQCCDKAFMNSSFLQSHMQRRHPEEYDVRLMSEKQRKVQAVKLQDEINKLKEQLSLTRSQLEVQQQAHMVKASQDQEQRSKEEEVLKHLERWKEEERERLGRQMEDMREMFLREAKDLKAELQQYKTQVTHLSELEQSHRKMRSLQEEQLQASNEERHRDDLRKLQQLLKKQDEKWTSRLQKTQEEHERERSQLQEDLRRLRGATEDQEASRRRVEELSWKLQEQRELIASQREQMRQLSLNPPVRVAEPTVIITAAEPKPKPQVHDSSISEKKPEVKKQTPISTLKRDPILKRELRQALEQTLVEKLESFGIKEGVNRLSKEEHTSVLAKVRWERERRAKQFPDYRRIREDLSHSLTARARERERETDSGFASEPPGRPRYSPDALSEATQTRSRSGSLPSRVTQVVSRPGPQQPPQPAPRNKNSTLPKASTPRAAEFSSDEESEEEEEEEEERPSQKPSGAPRGQKSAISNGGVISVTRTAATATVTAGTGESDSDWTEGSDLDEIDPRQLQRYTGQNGIVGKAPQGNLVKDLSRSLERQLSDRNPRRPAGGVALLPEKKKETVSNAVKEAVQELKYTEIDEDDDDDWDISSLEDKPSAPKQDVAVPLKKSFDSSNTSVWGTSTGKGQEGGVQKGDTLKSSLVTVSDWSDSDEI